MKDEKNNEIIISINNYKKDFYLKEEIKYFNNGTLGPVPKLVFQKLKNDVEELESDPSDNYFGGININENIIQKMEKVRLLCSKFVHCDLNELIIMQSTTSKLKN
jgi:selenocysteine lyase/cysteine desulfurase